MFGPRSLSASAVGVVKTVCPGSFFPPPRQQLQHRQDGSSFPDPPQADLASQPTVHRPAVCLAHRDRPARTSQRLDHQRLRRRRRHASTKKGDQGRTPLCWRINPPRTTLVTHRANHLIPCRQQEGGHHQSGHLTTQTDPPATLRVPGTVGHPELKIF
jgi:hypothetical protein